ncbi:MAG: helix-turn-helix transcriptional regulator [Eubacteriales bacterium]|nr:helix-turn-helix transcriptional regulator [Eubacteriales bacterium]
MNQLQKLRLERGYVRQIDLASRIGVWYIDGPMISNFEKGKVLPTPETAETIAKILNCEIADIWPEYHRVGRVYSYTPEKRVQTFANASEPKKYAVVTMHIPAGKQNAVDYPFLRQKTGLENRQIRELVSEARKDGVPVANFGSGFYLIDEREDAARYYHYVYKTALSYLKRLWPLRKIMNICDDQLSFGFCLRCGEACGDGLYCESCENERKDRAASHSEPGQWE